jgi:hypothetical protein
MRARIASSILLIMPLTGCSKSNSYQTPRLEAPVVRPEVELCALEKEENDYLGKQIIVRGHYFRGKEGAMLFDHRCNAVLIVEIDPKSADDEDFAAFDSAWLGRGGQSQLRGSDLVEFSGRLMKRPPRPFAPRQPYTALVADRVRIDRQ